MMNPVLLVDDDQAVREALAQTLALGGLQPITAASFIEAKDHIARDFTGVIVSDIRMPGKDGFALLEHTRSLDQDLPVILLTGEGDIPTAVRGISEGAYDFLEKPCDPSHLLEVVEKALKTRALVLENRRLKQDLETALDQRIGFLGGSTAARQVRDAIRRGARADAPVLVSGGRGCGRGFVARLVDEARRGPGAQTGGFAQFDCAHALPDAALTDADRPILLCNIERLAAGDQARLLRFIADKPGCAIYATSGPDPEALVQKGVLDDELYFTLAVVRIRVPPLSDRREDVPILFDKFLREEIDAGAPVITADGQAAARGLAGFDWSSDLRALRNHAKRVAWGLERDGDEPGLKPQLERVERALIQDALRRNAGHATDTAKALGLPRKTFYDRLQKLMIRAEDFRD